MEPTLPSPADDPDTLAERCIAVAIKIMKPTDAPSLRAAIAEGRQIHAAVLEMQRKERDGPVVTRVRLPGLPPDIRADILRRHANGQRPSDIARALELMDSTVRSIIRRNAGEIIEAKESGAAAPTDTGRGDGTDDVGGASPLPLPGAAALPPAVTAAPDPDGTPRGDAMAAAVAAQAPALPAAPSPAPAEPPSSSLSRISADAAAKMQPRYEAGESVAVLADEHGVTKQTIYNLATKHGWIRPPQRRKPGDAVQAKAPVKTAAPTDHFRGWSAEKVTAFTEGWLSGLDAEVIGEMMRMPPGTVAAAAAGLGIADDPRRKEARKVMRAPAPAPKPAPAAVKAPTKPLSPARAQFISGLGAAAAARPTAPLKRDAASDVPPEGLPDAEPGRDVMLMDGPELAGATRKAGFIVSQIAGTSVPQWRIGNGDTVLGLAGMRRLVAGLRASKNKIAAE